jgi:integrase
MVAPEEAECLLSALPDDGLLALYWTAYLSGARRGELRALRWSSVDFDAGVLKIAASWDDVAGAITPKSAAGTRKIPMSATLRRILAGHKLARGGAERHFVFPGSEPDRPFTPTAVRRRAENAWQAFNKREIERAKQQRREPELLKPVGLHELRHSYASLMIAAGVNTKALSAYMGHSSITITLDLYGHLMPGNEAEAAHMLDAFLAARREQTA